MKFVHKDHNIALYTLTYLFREFQVQRKQMRGAYTILDSNSCEYPVGMKHLYGETKEIVTNNRSFSYYGKNLCKETAQ